MRYSDEVIEGLLRDHLFHRLAWDYEGDIDQQTERIVNSSRFTIMEGVMSAETKQQEDMLVVIWNGPYCFDAFSIQGDPLEQYWQHDDSGLHAA